MEFLRQIAHRLGVARKQAELFALMPQQPAQLSEVNQVLNVKGKKRTRKLAQVYHALQAEIRVRQPSKAGSGN
jgi:DnaJ-domain-containing protein 1